MSMIQLKIERLQKRIDECIRSKRMQLVAERKEERRERRNKANTDEEAIERDSTVGNDRSLITNDRTHTDTEEDDNKHDCDDEEDYEDGVGDIHNRQYEIESDVQQFYILIAAMCRNHSHFRSPIDVHPRRVKKNIRTVANNSSSSGSDSASGNMSSDVCVCVCVCFACVLCGWSEGEMGD